MESTTPVTSACEQHTAVAEEAALELAADAALAGTPLAHHLIVALRTVAPHVLATLDALDAAVRAAGPACADWDPESMFLLGDDPAENPPEAHVLMAEREQAAELCRTCAVPGQCLALSFALTAPGRQGVWGGLTARDRRELQPHLVELRKRLAARAAAERAAAAADGEHRADEVA